MSTAQEIRKTLEYKIIKSMKTHYDTLKLDKNCSSKEIKDSYIKLSKEFHPDLNKSFDAQKKFVEVNEAYSVLGKEHTRIYYDSTLLRDSFDRTVNTTGSAEKSHKRYSHSANEFRTYEDYVRMYAQKRQEYQNSGAGPYMTRGKLASFVGCCIVIMFGSSLQFLALERRRKFRTQELAEALKRTKADAEKVGRMGKIKEFEDASLRAELNNRLK